MLLSSVSGLLLLYTPSTIMGVTVLKDLMTGLVVTAAGDLEAALVVVVAVSLLTMSRPVEVMVREPVSMGSQLGALVLVTLQGAAAAQTGG
jgi:hypothetical protein